MSIAGIYIIYAVLLILGGIMGFAKAKSRPSLISGIVTGAISLLIALLSRSQIGTASTLGILLGIGLGIFFINRYLATKKVMPAMFMAAVSFIVALGTIVISIVRPHAS